MLFHASTVAIGSRPKTHITSFDDLLNLGTVQLIAMGHAIVRWSFLPEESYAFWPKVALRDLEYMGPFPRLPLSGIDRRKKMAAILHGINTTIFGSPLYSARVDSPHEKHWLNYRSDLLRSWKWTAENADTELDWGVCCNNPWIDIGSGKSMSGLLHDCTEQSLVACVKLGAVAFIGTPRDFREFTRDNLSHEANRMIYILANVSIEHFPPFRNDYPNVTLSKAIEMLRDPESDFLQRIKDSAGVAFLDMHAMDNGEVHGILALLATTKAEGSLRRWFKVFLCGLLVTPGSLCLIHHLYSLHNPPRVISKPTTLYEKLITSNSDTLVIKAADTLHVMLNVFKSREIFNGVVQQLEIDRLATNAPGNNSMSPLILFSSASSNEDIESLFPAANFRAVEYGCLLYRRRGGEMVQIRSLMLQAYLYEQPLSVYSPERDISLAHMVVYTASDDAKPSVLADNIVEPAQPFRVGSRFVQPFSHVIFINPSEYISSVDISILQSIAIYKLAIMTLGTKSYSNDNAKLCELLSLCVGDANNNNNNNNNNVQNDTQ